MKNRPLTPPLTQQRSQHKPKTHAKFGWRSPFTECMDRFHADSHGTPKGPKRLEGDLVPLPQQIFF